MMLKDQTLLLLLLPGCIHMVACFSDGKVQQACGDMMPEHGKSSSAEPAPYSITVDKLIYNPGEQIKVTLSVATSEDSTHFKGFLIEARDMANPSKGAVGSFRLLNPDISQLLSCGSTQGSAVSHTSDRHKTRVEVSWISPENPPASVQFLVTVVQKYSVFWVKVPGPVVSQHDASPVPPQPTSDVKMTTSMSTLSKPFTSEGCGSRKSCLREPIGCDPQNDTPCHFLSFSTLNQSVVFELSGPADGYVSFALSLDKWMGNDDVYLCVKNDVRIDIYAAFVQGRTHPESASEDVLRDRAGRLADGVIQCRFSRGVSVSISQQAQHRFSLDQKYYLFLAHGRAEDGRIHRHDRQPMISTDDKLITGAPEDLRGSRSPLLMKFHGAFMLLAWMTVASTGVLIARYFKPDWPERSLCGQRVWFQLHRALMVLSLTLSCVGFILPFVYRGHWSKRAGSHPYLGCIVMVLAVLQPVMAVFRPATDSSRRYVFNWLHFGTGTVAQVMAVAAIFLGIHQQALCLPAPWSTGLVAGCVVWAVLADLVLEFHRRGLLPSGKYSSNVQMHSGEIYEEDKDEILIVPSESETHIKNWFKRIVLAVYLCGNLTFLMTLLVTISGV